MAEIEAEQALVAANRELITRFQQKIQATLARIGGKKQEARRMTVPERKTAIAAFRAPGAGDWRELVAENATDKN